MMLEYLLYLADKLHRKNKTIKISEMDSKSIDSFVEQIKKQLEENDIKYLSKEEYKEIA